MGNQGPIASDYNNRTRTWPGFLCTLATEKGAMRLGEKEVERGRKCNKNFWWKTKARDRGIEREGSDGTEQVSQLF